MYIHFAIWLLKGVGHRDNYKEKKETTTVPTYPCDNIEAKDCVF